MTDIRTDEGFFTARDGVRLFWHTARPSAQAPGATAQVTAHIALLHGYAEHLGRHAEVTQALVQAGYTVHLLDVRGHGQSGGKRAFVEKFGDYLDDTELFLARVREEAQGAQLFLLGHSHGSLIAARYLLDKPDAVKGAIFCAPYFKLKLPVPPIKILVGRLVNGFLPSLPMKNELHAELLTRDLAIQQETKADPLYQQIATPRWFVESTLAQETVLRRATEFVTPFLMLFGGADPIADPAAGKQFFNAATSKDKQLKVYDGLLHELFHEPERDLVFKDLVAWLDERAKAIKPGARPAAAGQQA